MAKKRQPMLPGMPRNRELLSDSARYKKGYTPKRQEEMANALKGTEIDYIHPGGHKASDFSQSPDRLFSGTQRGLVNRSRQAVVSAFANSSIKPERIGGLKKVELHDEGVPIEPGMVSENVPEVPKGSMIGAMYSNSEATIKVSQGLRKDRKNRTAHALIHELGHHVTIPALNELADDTKKFPNDHRLLGAAEGLADNFAHRNRGKDLKGSPKAGSTYLRMAKGTLADSDGSAEPDWAHGYASSVDQESRSKIFHNTRSNAQQLEIGFGQH